MYSPRDRFSCSNCRSKNSVTDWLKKLSRQASAPSKKQRAKAIALKQKWQTKYSQPASCKASAQSFTNHSNYLIQSGDTLTTIANKYGTSVTALKALNQLTNDTIVASDMLKVPKTK